jgi:hypothetical protein
LGAVFDPVKVTVTPGSGAPAASVIFPVMFPLLAWAASEEANKRRTQKTFKTLFMPSLLLSFVVFV